MEKTWKDVLGLSTDSAEYMKKLCNDHRAAHNSKLLQFNDVSHFIHVAVDTALHCSAMDILKKVVIKFEALFKHAHKLELKFKEICLRNELHESELCKPKADVPI